MTDENGGDPGHGVNDRNAQALSDNLNDLRASTSLRFTALENEVATMRKLVASQNQVIGDALQRLMGHGSTVADSGD